MIKQRLKKIYRKSKYYLPPVIFDKLNYLRAYKEFLKYKDLVAKNIELKDKHKGERCFILGSGPSIKKEDLKPLKNEIVFALNNFYVHEDFDIIMSGEKAKYYMTAPIHPPQTEEEWKAWFEDMEKHMPKHVNMLFGLNNYKQNIKYILDKYGIFKEHKINWYFAGVIFNEHRFHTKFLDISNIIYTSEAAVLYALIIAMDMGFNRIYLLGMDHNYILYDNENEMRMYNKAINQNNELKRTFGDDFYILEFYRQYKIFLKYKYFTQNFDSEIYNLSKDSLLKIFPKLNLKDIINE